MKTKEFVLKASWIKEDLDRIMGGLSRCQIPDFFYSRINRIVIKEETKSQSWLDSFKLGRITKKAIVYYYFVEMNMDGLNDAQQTVVSGFWQGFLSGRDSKWNGGSFI